MYLQVKFEMDNINYERQIKDCHEPNLAVKALSVGEDLHLEHDDEGEQWVYQRPGL